MSAKPTEGVAAHGDRRANGATSVLVLEIAPDRPHRRVYVAQDQRRRQPQGRDALFRKPGVATRIAPWSVFGPVAGPVDFAGTSMLWIWPWAATPSVSPLRGETPPPQPGFALGEDLC